jgi:tetrahydromethanopterin S-methyltransferase subunit F
MAQIVTAVQTPNMSSAQTSVRQAVRAVAVASVGVPTKAEFDAVVDLVNDLRQTLINAGLAS